MPTAGPGGGAGDRAGRRDLGGGPRRVGAALREARERRGLTVEEVGSAVRFTPRQVLAVEEGRTADLPPHPYARGLVAAYAVLLGLDADAATREWGRAPGEEEAGRRSVFRVPLRARSSWRDWAVPIACACGTAAFLVIVALQRPSPVEMPASLPAPRQGVAAAPQEEADVPAAVPEAPAQEDAGVTVVLRSEGSTWLEVSADGEDPRRQELGPGEQLQLRAQKRLGLALGDAGAVRVTVNGRELGFIGDKGEARTGIVFEAPAPGTAPKGDAAGGQGR